MKTNTTLRKHTLHFVSGKLIPGILFSLMLLSGILFARTADAQSTVTIGSGTATNYLLPINSYYGYTYSQQLYFQSEIGTGGTISVLRFYMVGGVSLNNSNQWVVYMGHTSKTSFSSSTDWIALANLTQVFSGTIDATPVAGWYTITLSTPFVYNNTDNLVIAIDENKPSFNGTINYCRIYTPSGSNRAIYYQSDGTNPDPASPPTATARQNNINQIQLEFTGPMQYSSCTTEVASTAAVYSGSSNNEVIRLNVVTTGSTNPLSTTSITFGTNGSTSTADISGAKVYYTTGTTFSTASLFGSPVANPNGTFTVTGTQQLASGNNYFWLAYDLPITATPGNVIDGECTSVTVDGTPRNPSVTAPSGSRTISDPTTITIGSGTSTQGYPFYPYYYTRSAGLYTVSQMGTNGTITHLGWYVPAAYSNNYSNIKIYLKTTTSSSLSADTWANMISGATLVYNSSYNFSTTGWNTIDITDFSFSSGNLLVLCEYNGNQWLGSYSSFRYTTVTNQHMQYQGSSPPTGNGTVNNQLPNIQMTFASGMRYSSSTTETASTATVYASSSNNEIIRLNVVTTGTLNPINATSITFSTNGSTSTADISAAKVYYTTNTTFSTATQFGTTFAAPDGSFTVNGSQQLATGNNYFWLAYDVPITATSGNVIDAECSSVTVASVAQTPTVTAPSGSRTITYASFLVTSTTGTTSATYSTLADAIAKINDGTHSGAVTLYIGADVTLANNTGVSINASGSGGANYTSLYIRPYGGATRTITGNTTTSDGVIKINGGDNITIDGLNTGGNALIIKNMYNYNSPVIFLSGASSSNFCSNNKITNCTILGNNQGGNYGLIAIYNYVSSLEISNCNLSSATPASYPPVSLIWSSGHSSYPNTGITITGNNLYDYGCATGGSAVNLYNYNTSCNISNNRIYQPSSKTFSGSSDYYGIYVGGGSGHTINGNVIGYANSSGTGTTSLSFSSYSEMV